MKLLVETKGEYAIQDLIGRQIVEAYRPCVVEKTAFIGSMIGYKLNVLDELSDEADDKPLADAKDLDAAIAALPRAAKPTPKLTAKK